MIELLAQDADSSLHGLINLLDAMQDEAERRGLFKFPSAAEHDSVMKMDIEWLEGQ